jgi:HK97 gp10 family phage protein
MARPVRYDIEIEGWEELEAKLQAMAADLNTQETLENALNEGAEVVRDSIAGSAPVRTGQLSGNITISKQGRVPYSVRIGPSGAGFYGRFLEYGTRKMGARPFVRPAFDGVRVSAQAAIREAIWQAVQEHL